ncbi:MAG: hypothetical protein CVU20_13170 [Betaproteobacteria bacterium HGW-Betaproteobacteria-14]|nr:MAG: hypothetical protein CVU20_13170 [Betaproteobacteria bacterium HGW-Betaproteobacteria-14]
MGSSINVHPHFVRAARALFPSPRKRGEGQGEGQASGKQPTHPHPNPLPPAGEGVILGPHKSGLRSDERILHD